MPARNALARVLGLILLLLLVPQAGLTQPRLPHVPTEQELEQRRRGSSDESERDYQERSVDSVRGRAVRAAGWVKEQLSGFHVTPARLLLGLGLAGALITWNKNKRKPGWAALTALAWLLLGIGAAAILLGWRSLN